MIGRSLIVAFAFFFLLPSRAANYECDALRVLAADPQFNPRKSGQPAFRQNWAMHATGGDLLRKNSAVRSANYDNSKIAVIDTDLRVKESPDSGRALVEATEKESRSGHGTMVLGVIASAEYGVNPALKIRPFHASGFSNLGVRGALKAAIADDSVKLINLSRSYDSEPEIDSLIAEALGKGKWVVYAAGNEGGVNDKTSAAGSPFFDHPGFFVSGALSSFASPASFSHHGPGVKFYSPGSEVDTLNDHYAPAFAGARSGTSVSGTSFSAPHLSAVLATLSGMRPSLSGSDVRLILEKTSIRRGKDGQYLQVNPLHAAELIERANKLEDNSACQTYSKCLALAEGEIKAETDKGPNSPHLGADRESWEKYYEDLRRGYFLSDGDPRFATALADFHAALGEGHSMEMGYYAPARAAAPSQAVAVHWSKDHNEYQRAKKALAQTPTTSIGNLKEDLAALPSHVPVFMREAEEWLKTGVDKNHSYDFINSAQPPFLMELGRKLAEKNEPLGTTKVAFAILNAAHTPTEKAVAAKVLDLTVQGWKNSASIGEFERFLRHLDELTPTQKLHLYQDFKELRANGQIRRTRPGAVDPDRLDKAEGTLLADLPAKELAGREDFARRALVDGEDDDGNAAANAEFYFQIRRLAVGEGSVEKAGLALRELFRSERERPPRMFDFFDDFFRSATDTELKKKIEFLSKFSTGPEVLAYALLADDANIRQLAKMTDAVPVLEGLASHVSPSDFAKLVDSLLPIVNEDGTKKREISHMLLRVKESASGRSYYQSLLSGPQSDPTRQAVRLFLMEAEMAETEPKRDTVGKYLAEAPGNEAEKMAGIPLHQIMKDESLRLKLKDVVSAQSVNRWLSFAFPEDARELAKIYGENLHRAETTPTSFQSGFEIGFKLAGRFGNDPEINQLFFQQAHKALSSTDRADVAGIIAGLSLGNEGLRLLENDPNLAESIAVKIASGKTQISHIPPPVMKRLESRLPPPDASMENASFPPWARQVLGTDAAQLDRMLSWLKSDKASSLDKPRRREWLTDERRGTFMALDKENASKEGPQANRELIRDCLRELLTRHPELASRVHDFNESNPNSIATYVLELIGYVR